MARWLGKYEVLRPIGKGGMAELHLARAGGAIAGAHKLVVLKQMLPWLAEDESFQQMFVDEARLALALDHPNVVHVYDVGSADGRYFYAMEYLHGEDVAHILAAARAQGRPVPLGEALAVAIGVAAGLHYAHEKRGADGAPLEIVHRDVSPQNVVVTFDGAVKLLDFGIAKAAHRLTETRQGTIKGKVRYMAPEQIRSEPLDRRADVFALGVLLWELTTGRALYDGASEFAVQRQIVDHDAPAPSTVAADYPPALERIVLRAVARRRDERFASAEELQLALEELAREHKLAVSSVGLARYLRELFAPREQALRQAQAAGDDAVTELVLAELASRPRGGDDDDGDNDDSENDDEFAASDASSAGGAGTRALAPIAAVPSTATRGQARRGRRGTIAAAVAAAIVASVAVLLAQPYFAAPDELLPPPRAPEAARVVEPIRAELPPAARPPAAHATRATTRHHKRPHARWDEEAALPPP